MPTNEDKSNIIDYQSKDVLDDVLKDIAQDVRGGVPLDMQARQHFDDDMSSETRSMGTRCTQHVEIPRTPVEPDGGGVGRLLHRQGIR